MLDSEIEKYLEAGRIAAAARDLGASLIRPGTRMEEVQLAVEELIRSRGARPAFPAQISLDHVAAHDCCPPGDPRVFLPDHVAKLDVGAHVDGFVADTAVTVDLREGPESPLAAAAAEALEAAIALARPGVPVKKLGEAVEKAIRARGFKPVMNLTGHGLDRFQIHCSPQIPNYRENSRLLLEEGRAVAIEPFASTGKGWVEDRGAPQVFQLKRRPKAKDMLPLALEQFLLSFHGLPSARLDLARALGTEGVEEALSLLLERRLLVQYPPLAEEPGTRISQMEHTLLLLPGRVIVTTDPERDPILF